MNPSFYLEIKKDLAMAYDLCSVGCDSLVHISEMVCDNILQVGNFFGRQVTLISNHLLPKKIAKIIQNIFNSAPFIATWHILPGPYCTLLSGVMTISSICRLKPFSSTTYINFYNGQAFHFLTNAAKDFVGYTVKGHFGLFIAMCLDLTVSAIYAINAQRIEHANS